MTPSLLIFQALVLGAFLFGLFDVVFFGYLIYSGRAAPGSDQFVALAQVNGYAYGSATMGLFLFRMNRKPPKGVEVSAQGLSFSFPTGRTSRVRWDDLEGQTRLYEVPREERDRVPPDMHLQLYTEPKYLAVRIAAFLPPKVPRTYLTRDAFDSIIEGASRAGLTVTRYGDRYVMDRLNPMQFPPRF